MILPFPTKKKDPDLSELSSEIVPYAIVIHYVVDTAPSEIVPYEGMGIDGMPFGDAS